jgi:hypothetical protein
MVFIYALFVGLFYSQLKRINTPMKVNEIICEVWYNPLTWGKSAAASDPAATAKAAKDALAAYKKVPGADAELIKVYQSIVNDGNAAARAAAQTSLLQKIGNWSWVLRVLGSLAICVELYYNLDQAEKHYMTGKTNPEQFEKARKAFIGLWTVQFFTPWFIHMIANSRLVLLLARVVLSVLTLGSGVLTGPAAIAGLVVEQAVFTALQAFMMTKTFENWMATNFFGALVAVGTVPDESWNLLRKYLSEIPVINTFMQNKGDTYYDSEKKIKQQKNPAAAAKDKQADLQNALSVASSAKNSVVINGIDVTDAQGYLNDYAYMDPKVQYAIKYTPNDPNVKKLASIPRKPGSIY